MAFHANILSPLVVAHVSLRNILDDAHISLETAPSSKIVPPSIERHLLTFMAAVCSLHPDCVEAAVAVARGTSTSGGNTLYIAAIHASDALQSAFCCFIGGLRDAYHPSPNAAGTCGDRVWTAMYRFAYPALRECLHDDSSHQQTLRYFAAHSHPTVLQALQKLKDIAKESDPSDMPDNLLRIMKECCDIIHTFDRQEVTSGSPEVEEFLTEIASVRAVASYFDLVISGECLLDQDVRSLIEDSHGREWNVVWIPSPSPPSTAFEAEVLTSDVAAWLDEYSRYSARFPWEHLVSQIAACCPEGLAKTGSRYTTASDGPPQIHSIHCEIALLLWLIENDILVDKHIGCSSVLCYMCAKLAQALGTAYPKHDVALSDILDSTEIELPWTCPPGVPDAVIETMRTMILRDFRAEALTYVTRDGVYDDALGTEIPDFAKVHEE